MRGKIFWIAAALTMLIAGSLPFVVHGQRTTGSFDDQIKTHLETMFEEGRRTFRFDTFGDEAFWGDALKLHEAIVRKVLAAWGPGKFDAELFLDGKGFRHDGKTAATLIPPAFGLAGVNLHTFTGFGSVTYWNAFVANLEMHGQGTFIDSRLNDSSHYPVAARAHSGNTRTTHDMITSKLAALHFYQLAIPAPSPS